MKLHLGQQTSQKLSPSTIQLLLLIQMNSLEMESYIEKIAQENPVLELEPLPAYDLGFKSAKAKSSKGEAKHDHSNFDQHKYIEPPSIRDEICIQLDSCRPDKTLRQNVLLLSTFLDKKAYLDAEDYAFIVDNIGENEASRALELLQSFSPAGIAARDLPECLCLQLKRLPEDSKLAQEIAKNYLELVAKGHYAQIAKQTGSSVKSVLLACEQIRALDPKPGSVFESHADVEYIIPDLFLEEDGSLMLNSRRIPRIEISDYYRGLLKSCADPEVEQYLRKKFRQAEQLTLNIQSRNCTIMRCAEAILTFQNDFFVQRGLPSTLVPLTHAQISEYTGVNKSTVSRAIRGKYIQCPFGIYSLDSFFSSGLSGAVQAVSSTDAKERLKSLVALEDKQCPLSDQDIADRLSADGIKLSRRTVAKYRQQLNIPSTLVRKK